MKLVLLLLACVALASSSAIKSTKDVKYFDESMLQHQKFFTEIVFKPWEPLVWYFPEWATLGEKFIFDKAQYHSFDEEMRKYHETYMMIPRGHVFNVYNMEQLNCAKGLFKFFYYAKDFATLQKNICWARQYANEGMFLYALQMFVMHHPEYQYVVLPPLYEMLPHMFYNGKFIYSVENFDLDTIKYEEQYYKKMMDLYKAHEHDYSYQYKYFNWNTLKFHHDLEKTILRDDVYMTEVSKYADFFKDVNMYWMKADYTNKYTVMNEHAKLTYLTEDFDWNMFWYYFNMQYPFWMHGDDYKLDERRGEYFMFVVQQLLARYQLERYSHGFAPIDEFSFHAPIEYGYNPELVTYYGVPFSYRKNYYEFVDTSEYHLMNYIESAYEKMLNLISKGYYIRADGTKFYFNKPESIKEIGLILQGSVDSIDRKFFSSYLMLFHTIASFGDAGVMQHNREVMNYLPHAMHYYETMMRDPLFYMIYTKVYSVFKYFKYSLGPYKHEELFFSGVRITDVTTEKLETYFDLVDSDASVLLDKEYFLKDGKFSWDYAVFGRRHRLNNKPFSITYKFDADKAEKVVFRTFIGPKYDEFGKYLHFDESRANFYELDQFVYQASAGENTFVRDSRHFFWTRQDHTTYVELYKYVMLAFEGKYQFPVDYDQNKFCGFPERLLLPRGWTGGMPMKLYVIATPFDESVKEYSYEEHDMYCGMEYDKHPYGFPLDRPIDELYFWTPNMYYKDISIYHLEDYHMSSEMKYFFSDKLYF